MLSFSLSRDLLRDQWCAPGYRFQALLHSSRAHEQLVPLGSLATIRSGTYIDEYRPDGLPFVRVDSIREFQLNLNPEDGACISPNHPDVNPRVQLQPGDVVISRTGTLGKAFVAL